jgi:hypothetical protein
MSDFQNEMNRTVQSFVAQISELARRAALDTLESAFNSGPTRKASGSATARTTGPGAAAPLGRVGRPAGIKGGKRTAEELEELTRRVVDFVKANPGLRIEQINKQLGTTTKDLALPIRKLVAEGYLSSKGQKRSTTYSVGKKTWKN